MDEGQELIAGSDDAGRRLDRVLRILLDGQSLSAIYAALRKGRIRVNGDKVAPNFRVSEGDRIYVHPSLAGSSTEPRAVIGASPTLVGAVHTIDDDFSPIADILILATKDLLFINKPRGQLSQGSAGIEGRVRKALAQRSSLSLSFIPGPLHRLDRNTTGILTYPRSTDGARIFTSLIRQRKVTKRYLALVDGEASSPVEWRDRIVRDERARRSFVAEDGDEALAFALPLLSRGGHSLLLVELYTGLTHQIRVQASSRGMPLSGDAKYGGSPNQGGYILHAASLEFPEPPFTDLPRLVSAPLPISALDRLGSLFGRAVLRDVLDGIMKAS